MIKPPQILTKSASANLLSSKKGNSKDQKVSQENPKSSLASNNKLLKVPVTHKSLPAPLSKDEQNYSPQYNNPYEWALEGFEILKSRTKTHFTQSDKHILYYLLQKDIPPVLRNHLWMISSGAREKMFANRHLYKNLLKSYDILIKNKHPFYEYLDKKISIDLHRSFNSPLYGTQENINILKNILHAFTVRNISINYSQGLNIILAQILINMKFNEEESFFLFIKLMEDLLPYDFYLFSIGIETDLKLINDILYGYENSLFQHLEKINGLCIVDSRLSMWVISILTCNVDKKVTNFFFDCVFFFSRTTSMIIILFSMIWSIFKILKTDLLLCRNINDVNKVFMDFFRNP